MWLCAFVTLFVPVVCETDGPSFFIETASTVVLQAMDDITRLYLHDIIHSRRR